MDLLAFMISISESLYHTNKAVKSRQGSRRDSTIEKCAYCKIRKLFNLFHCAMVDVLKLKHSLIFCSVFSFVRNYYLRKQAACACMFCFFLLFCNGYSALSKFDDDIDGKSVS
ncbi:hypothetical protein D917_04960 [Trichinella nativa]|uniref:Uncharacterized protein n=1 Tax=Trichinella nativa TaxID=6335 RepID=A0A1Y3EXM8_9BILA|nr:hypothetical protein D917_04960 [Trichinella nativa]